MAGPDNKRIARNTAYLYVRMLVSTLVALYTSRVVLETLGERDFGIYNLVGGIVVILSFLNGTMAAATMRFLNYEMGVGDKEKLRRTFGTAVRIHLFIAVIMFVVAETAGLWFVNTQLVIEPSRMVAANWTYQMSILASLVGVIQIPFTAAIMAHEEMDAYAAVSLTYTFLKLGIVLILLWIVAADDLIAYSILFFIITLLVGLAYIVYCRRKFAECRGRHTYDRKIAKTMVSFSGWDFYGTCAWTTRAQGASVIINRFGGTTLNAAAGLAVQVATTLQAFAGSIIGAFRPQIVQQYAQRQYDEMLKLLYNAAKFSALLILIFVVPIFIEMPYALKIWLHQVPEHTVVFARLCLIAMLGELLKMVTDSGIHATGKIVRLSLISGTMLLAELPVMWWLIWYLKWPAVVYLIHAVWIFAIVLAENLILKYQLRVFSIARFWLRGLVVPAVVAAPAVAGALAVATVMPEGFLRFCLCVVVSTSLIVGVAYGFALDRSTRQKIKCGIKKKLGR